MTVTLTRGVYLVRGTCEWCGRRYCREYVSRKAAEKARYCSRGCGSQRNATRNTARPELVPLAATRSRQKRRYATAYVTRQQIWAVWYMYQSGWSISALARKGWRVWGYASKDSAEHSLRMAFRLEGFTPRGKAEARRLAASGVCSGCGTNHDDRTVGCKICKSRHKQRREAARRDLAA